MSKYRCSMCGFEYDEAEGYADLNILPGTKWEDLPDDFSCPICGAEKGDFYLVEEESEETLKKEPEKEDIKEVENIANEGNYRKYVCSLCGYVFDEAVGCKELGIPAGTRWEDIKEEDFNCPWCGAAKSDFYLQEDGQKEETIKEEETESDEEDFVEIPAIELSAICSNLGRGYEKQYKELKASKYYELAEYFKKKAEKEKGDVDKLLKLEKADLDLFTSATDILKENKDRGALRSIVWSEKVTKIINTLIAKYNRGEDFENQSVYVCTICGFIFVGDKLPEVCPVCKVPNFKFEKII